MKKEFTYKGKTLEELQAMDVKQFAELTTSRQRRSLLRGFTDAQKALIAKLEKKNKVKTHVKDIVVIPLMVGKTLEVHNGKQFVSIQITPEHLGHVLGEFVLTRNKVTHNSPGVGATRSSSNVSVK